MAQRPFAVFDIDGTLIRWQLYHAVVDKLAKEGALGETIHEQLHEARMIWKRREHHEAFRTYEQQVIKLYEQAFQKLSTKDFDRIVLEVIDEYKDQTYVYTRELLQKLKQTGYILLAISGSHHELIEQLARYYHFDDWIGTKYRRAGELFSGQKVVASKNKRKSLEKMVAKHDATCVGSIAIGDSSSDQAMLEIVERPIAFNPDRSLFEIARQHGWKVVIERKNMIYELESKNDEYVLQ